MIRVISVSYFVLPLLKLLNKKIILSYHYDYRTMTEKDFGGIKGFTAGLREYLSIKSADLVIVTTEELKRKVQNIYHKDSIVILCKFYILFVFIFFVFHHKRGGL